MYVSFVNPAEIGDNGEKIGGDVLIFDLFCFPNSYKNISPESVLCQKSADIPT